MKGYEIFDGSEWVALDGRVSTALEYALDRAESVPAERVGDVWQIPHKPDTDGFGIPYDPIVFEVRLVR